MNETIWKSRWPKEQMRAPAALEDAIPGKHIQQAILLSESNEDETLVSGVPVKTQSITGWLLGQ